MSDTVAMGRLYVAPNFFTIVLGSNLDQGIEYLDIFCVFSVQLGK